MNNSRIDTLLAHTLSKYFLEENVEFPCPKRSDVFDVGRVYIRLASKTKVLAVYRVAANMSLTRVRSWPVCLNLTYNDWLEELDDTVVARRLSGDFDGSIKIINGESWVCADAMSEFTKMAHEISDNFIQRLSAIGVDYPARGERSIRSSQMKTGAVPH